MRSKILLLVLAFSIIFCFSCNKESKGFEQLIPKNAKFFVKFQSLKSLTDVVKQFGLGKRSQFIKKSIGFDPLNEEDLSTFGIDPKKDFGFFFTTLEIDKSVKHSPPKMNMAFAIPVSKGSNLIENIEKRIMEKKEDFKFIKVEGKEDLYLVPKIDDEKNPPKIYLKQISNYLFVALGHQADPLEILNSIGTSSIKDSPVYSKIAPEISNGSVVAFADFDNGEFFSKLFSSIGEMNKDKIGPKFNMSNFFKGYKGAGFSIDFSTPDLKAKGVGFFDKDAPINDLQKSITYDKKPLLSIQKNPALLLSFGLNINKYMEMLLSSFEDEGTKASMDQGLNQVKETLGLDIKEDILKNIGGNLNLGFFDLSELKTMKINGLLSISLKDSKKIADALNILKGFAVKSEKFSIQEETIDGVTTFVINIGMVKIYAGIKDSFIISSNLDIYKQALAGKSNDGFVPKLKDPLLKSTFKDSDFFYLDINEIFVGLKSALPLIGGASQGSSNPWLSNLETITDALGEFEYILTSAKIQGEMKTNTMIIKTKFKESFFEGIGKLIKKFRSLEKAENKNQDH